MPRLPRALFVLVFAALFAGVAAAGIEERPLRAGTGPLALMFDEAGMLWVTLDRAWAVGRFDPVTDNLTEYALGVDRAGPTDELSGIHVAADAVWTASSGHLHRVDRATGNVTSVALPTPSDIAGDVLVSGLRVFVAGVTSDRVSVHHLTNGRTSELVLDGAVGPLGFVDSGGPVYVSLTYAGSVAKLGAMDAPAILPKGSLRGPVGIAFDDGDLWVAEMGGSSVARVTLEGGAVERWPTSPSPFYVISGPSDVLVDGGRVWFAEHFADRIGLLDPDAGTLVEWMAPSAPGSNLQRLARGPDGRVWFAEWTKDKLGVVDVGSPGAFPKAPTGPLAVANGTVARVGFAGISSAASEPAALKVGLEGGSLVLDARSAPAGSYRVLVSSGDGRLLHGRYLEVFVTEGAGESDTPAVGGALLAAGVVAAAALARRREA